jgi:hypothetical protein
MGSEPREHGFQGGVVADVPAAEKAEKRYLANWALH